MKKVSVSILSFIFCLGLLNQTKLVSFAITTSEGFEYIIIDGEATITDFPGLSSGGLVIPSEIDGYPVTVLGENSFRGCDNMESVVIPDTVKRIELNAFYGCLKIADLRIGSSVEYIGDYAFSGCEALKALVLPESVKTIGRYAFAYGKELTDITFGKGLETIGEYAFAFNRSIKNIILPENLKSLGANAFSECISLETVRINKYLETIGKDAFYPCESFNMFQIVNGNQHFATRNGALYTKGRTELLIYPQNKSDKTYTLPETTVKINENAFKDVVYLETLAVPEAMHKLSEDILSGCRALSGITYLGDEAQFFNMAGTSLKNYDVTIGEKLIERVVEGERSDGTFTYGFYNGGVILYKYESSFTPWIPEQIEGEPVTIIAENAFSDNTEISELVIPDTVKFICENAFSNCSELESLGMCAEVSSIGENAFSGCEKLTTVAYFSTPDNWAEITFKNKTANPAFFTNQIYFGEELISDITLSEGITEIKPYSFCFFNNLKSISLPEGVTEIGEFAFEFCENLTEIKIPESVNKIGEYAFNYTSLESVQVSRNLNYIGDYAFSNTYIEAIELPESLRTLGSNVFYECYYLTDIYFDGTDTNWMELNAFSENDYTGITVRFYDFSRKVSNMLVPNEDTSIEFDKNIIFTDSTDNLNSYENILSISEDEKVTVTVTPSYSYGTVVSYGTGSVALFKDEKGNEKAFSLVVTGDVTGDGIVDVLDCMVLSLASHNEAQLDGNYFSAGDTNRDGDITIADYGNIVNKAVA